MRFHLSALALALTPGLAFAQPAPVPEEDPCADFGGFGGVPPPPGFGGLVVTSPPQGAFAVPRNVEIRLSGDVNALAVEPAQMSVQLIDNLGSRVPYERDGLVLHPLAPLPPSQTFTVRIEPTDAHPCVQCFGVQEVAFTTSDEIDREAPVLEGVPPVHVFVLPNGEQAEQCGVFSGQTHFIVVDFGPQLPLNTWITIAGKKEGDNPLDLLQAFNTGVAFAAQTNVGNTVPTALGDVFFVALTPRDLAGNVGAARIVRVRARSFIDHQLPRDQLSPLWCDMEKSPVVVAAETLPTNGEIGVEFPFEEVPVGLRSVEDPEAPVIPLVPVRESESGNVYKTAESLPAGASFDVVGLECTQCVCEGCKVFDPQRVVVGDAADTTAPKAPVLVRLDEDASPPLSVGEQCVPDRPALLAILEAGEDDSTAPGDMRYDANIAIDGQPPVVLGRSLPARDLDDGTVEVRIETTGFGRILGDTFELTLEAIDASGNRASATTKHGEPEESGCASTSSPRTATPFAALLFALALFTCRHRRWG